MTTALESVSFADAAAGEASKTGAAPTDGTTLSALIRDACERRERLAFGVRVGERSGHVFVDGGRVVHAELGRQSGLRAVLEMLEAEGLSIQPPTRTAPAHASVNLRPSELGSSPSDRSGVRPAATAPLPSMRRPRELPSRPTLPPPPASPRAHRPTLPAPPFDRRPRRPASAALRAPVSEHVDLTMVRLSRGGELLAARGGKAERLANAAAFIHHTALLIGDDLGHPARPSVCVEGNGQTLLVLSSRGRGVSAALGATSRLEDLSRKAGLS